MTNTCDECTVCCQGFLRADLVTKVTKRKIALGVNPCPYLVLNTGCLIHDDGNQPEICNKYQCLWLKSKDLPEIHKPSKSGWLLNREDSGQVYLIKVSENPCEVSKEVLIDWALERFGKVIIKSGEGDTLMIIRDLEYESRN